MIARLVERKCRPYRWFVSSKREIGNISPNSGELSGRVGFGAVMGEEKGRRRVVP
jgi:hypothetical protein